MNIKAIIFDMNGIIIDDEHIHERAFKQSLEPYGINLSHESYLDNCAGRTDKEGYERIAATQKKSLPIDLLLTQKADLYQLLFPSMKKVYPGILECINLMSNHFILALASSSIRKEVELITKEFNIFEKFKVIITGDDVVKGKPDPEPYLLTCKKLNISPNQAIVIEDSSSGVKSAIAAGCKCIAITTTHSKSQLSANTPTKIVDSFSKIDLDFIAGI